MTAERIYHYFKTYSPPTEWTILFHRDEHLLWASSQQENSKANRQVVEQTWHRVLERFEARLTMAQIEASTIRHNIERIQQPSYDYESILKQFASVHEEMKINEDEIDYIFYTYGLQMYGNIPLVEPLEYQEVLRIKEFVIVIDTSGSCEEQIVSRFLMQTYQILQQMTTDNRQVAIRIIQCDDTVQSDKVITSMAELEAYMTYEPLSGFGNTDFEAAFLYVEQLIEEAAARYFIFR